MYKYICVGNTYSKLLPYSQKTQYFFNKHILNETFGVIGYGPQGRAQSLNLRDNGYNVVLGLREGNSWKNAKIDGWTPGKNLFSIDEACDSSSIIQFLVSDAAQVSLWDNIKPYLNNKSLYFSHGFGIVFNEKTGIIPPKNTDVFMVAPKGSGNKLREKFISGERVNASYAVHQDYSGNALNKSIATAFAIGCDNLYETTFEKEVHSDLTGERCVLMGLIQGALKAQYEILRKYGHSPLESYNETIEEGFSHLYPMVTEKGMDWLYRNCSTTAQTGAIEWADKFEKVLTPVIEECYESVVNGTEAQKAIDSNSKPDYRMTLDLALNDIYKQEMWSVKRELDHLDIFKEPLL